MSHNPNTVKSMHELNETGRSSEVLLTTLAELEKTKKQLEIAVKALEEIKKRTGNFILPSFTGMKSTQALKEIEELNQ